jgi:hypothetical protein
MFTRSKRGGFKDFVRKRDGKPSVVLEGISEVKCVRLQPLLEVLRGCYPQLLNSFDWDTTLQGSNYWNSRDLGSVPLSPEDYQWLEELYNYHASK